MKTCSWKRLNNYMSLTAILNGRDKIWIQSYMIPETMFFPLCSADDPFIKSICHFNNKSQEKYSKGLTL